MTSLDSRLVKLEGGSTASWTQGMTTDEALTFASELPPKQQAKCLRRMTDDELASSIARLKALIAIDDAKTKRKRK